MDDSLRALLATLDPNARDALRQVLIHDQADRDAIATDVLRYRDNRGDDWADIIDMLTMHPEERRQVVRGCLVRLRQAESYRRATLPRAVS